MTMAELKVGIVKELLKKNYRYANIRAVWGDRWNG